MIREWIDKTQQWIGLKLTNILNTQATQDRYLADYMKESNEKIEREQAQTLANKHTDSIKPELQISEQRLAQTHQKATRIDDIEQIQTQSRGRRR